MGEVWGGGRVGFWEKGRLGELDEYSICEVVRG